MTKYTDEEIIAYLKTLREDDVLTANKSFETEYTAGDHYRVRKDEDGDLYIRDNDRFRDYISVGNDYRNYVDDMVREGVFEIPTPASAVKPFHLEITSYTLEAYHTDRNITVIADDVGLARLIELEAEGKKSRNIAVLYAKRTEVQAEIDRLEAKK